MNNAVKVLIVVLCLPLIALGVGAMFNPAVMSGNFAVDPRGIPGLSTIRGDIGGLLLGSAILMLVGIWRGNTTWFLAAAVMMSTVAFGRLVGFVVDGLDAAVAPAFVIEIVITAVMITVHRRYSADSKGNTG